MSAVEEDIANYFEVEVVDVRRRYELEIVKDRADEAILTVMISQRSFKRWDAGRLFTQGEWQQWVSESFQMDCRASTEIEMEKKADQLKGKVKMPFLDATC